MTPVEAHGNEEEQGHAKSVAALSVAKAEQDRFLKTHGFQLAPVGVLCHIMPFQQPRLDSMDRLQKEANTKHY